MATIRTEDSPRTYHFALLLGKYCGHRKDTVVLQVRCDIDCLDCEMWRYLGEKARTKKQLRENKAELLNAINATFNENFKRLIID